MTRTVTSAGSGGGTTVFTPAVNNWMSGTFGTGLIQLFAQNGSYTWTCPTGISSVRVRVWGAGAAGGSSNANAGGGGGGFAMGTYTVVAGTAYGVTVGVGGYNGGEAGGSSSFGSFISATGGSGGNDSSAHAGGTGSGGVINYEGGSTNGGYCGGGGAGSLFGHGGNGAYSNGNYVIRNPGPVTAGSGGGYGASGTTQMNSWTWSNSGLRGIDQAWPLGGATDTSSQYNWPSNQIKSLDELGTGGGSNRFGSGFALNGGGGAVSNGSVGGWPGGGGGPGSQGYGANGCVVVEY